MLCELLYPMKNFEWVSEHAGSSEGDDTAYDSKIYIINAEVKIRMNLQTARVNLLHAPKSRCSTFLRSKGIKSRLVMLRPFQSKSWKAVQRLQSTKVDENDSAIRASRYLARFQQFQSVVKQLRFHAYSLGPRLYFSPDASKLDLLVGI
jgi:hypothetical protein